MLNMKNNTADADILERAREFVDKENPFVKGSGEVVMRKHWLLEFMAKFASLELARQSAWVKCEDRLPEDDGGYLITDDEGFMLVSYFQVKQQRFVVVQDGLATTPIAWMPLPEPFQEANDER